MESSPSASSSKTATQPELVSIPGFAYIGFSERIDPASESNPATSKIGALWQKFYTTKAPSNVPNQSNPPKVLGVYTDYESDHNGKYTLTAACQVDSSEKVPPGMISGNVPDQKCLRFTAIGEQPASIIAAWKYIWSYFGDKKHPQRAFTNDFELYKSPELLEIYIAIK